MILSAIIEAMFGVSTEIADASAMGFSLGAIIMWLLLKTIAWLERDRHNGLR